MAGFKGTGETIVPRIDRSVVESLIGMLGSDSVHAFIAEFLEQAGSQRGLLEAAYQSGDNETLYRESHNLVSTAGNLGVKRTSRLADAVQVAVRLEDTEAIGPAVKALLTELDAMVDELPALIDEAVAA
ncbi:MAG: Hpt domain-containing protein [Rhodospirillaceae bacterium]|nr:Hpt domain-containing protein [Rhodospirillaceae bacterium]